MRLQTLQKAVFGVDEALIAYARIDNWPARPDMDLLSYDERFRAARFVHELDRRRFVAARVFLRRSLASLTGCAPADLVFAYEPNGKPFLTIPNAPAFNLSHAGGLAVLAVIASGAVGVDLERTKPLDDYCALAAMVMHPSELAAFCALPVEARRTAFYRHWTRKEALLKALGPGFAAEPRQFCVSLDTTPVLFPHHKGTPDWGVVDLWSPPGFAAALCAPWGIQIRHATDLEATDFGVST